MVKGNPKGLSHFKYSIFWIIILITNFFGILLWIQIYSMQCEDIMPTVQFFPESIYNEATNISISRKTTAIPRILHHIWLSPEGKKTSLLQSVERMASKAKELHEADGWIYKRWGNELWDMYDYDNFVSYYKTVIGPSPIGLKWMAIICDYIRLLILRDYGGIYTDIDTEFIQSFESLHQNLPKRVSFFAGMRKLKSSKKFMVEVAVIGSAPKSNPILEAIKRYQQFEIPLPFNINDQQLPFGGDIGKWFSHGYDPTTNLLSYHYFYISEKEQTERTICHQKPMQTWTNTMDEAFAVVFTDNILLTKWLILLKRVYALLRSVNVDGWIGGEALAGLARNGTLHPWQDQLDIFVNRRHLTTVKRLEKSLNKYGYIFVSFWGGFKIFNKSLPLIHKYKWAWPAVEIKWVDVKGKKVQLPGGGNILLKDDIYPVKEVMLNEVIPVQIPKKYDNVLKVVISADWRTQCKSRSWNRRTEKSVRSLLLECSNLEKMYPFNTLDEHLRVIRYGNDPSKKNYKTNTLTNDSSIKLIPHEVPILPKVIPDLTIAQKKAFSPILTPKIQMELLFILEKIDKIAKFDYWLGGDALIGLAFNDSLLAWYDAVDIYVNVNDLKSIELMKTSLAEYSLTMVSFWGGFKVFKLGNPVLNNLAWGYPSVEIITFSEKNNTYTFRTKKKVAKKMVEPLIKAKLNNIFVKIPNKIDSVLKVMEGTDYRKNCKSRIWSRITENELKYGGITVDCVALTAIYGSFQGKLSPNKIKNK